ncbi:MAG TPA: hypothetical protein VF704_04070 [Allosphingosinicella sp.]|jgi:hypothetical protein
MKGSEDIVGLPYQQARSQPPMAERRSPIVAFIVAFLFGFLGYGIYTGDWKAAFWLLITSIILFAVIPGIGLLLAGCICGVLAANRVSESNAAGGH